MIHPPVLRQFTQLLTPHMPTLNLRARLLLNHCHRVAATARPLLHPAPRALWPAGRSAVIAPLPKIGAVGVVDRWADHGRGGGGVFVLVLVYEW